MRRRQELAVTSSSLAYRRLQFPPGKLSRACSFGHDSWKLHRHYQDRTRGPVSVQRAYKHKEN